jgi:hypothetical protein
MHKDFRVVLKYRRLGFSDGCACVRVRVPPRAHLCPNTKQAAPPTVMQPVCVLITRVDQFVY